MSLLFAGQHNQKKQHGDSVTYRVQVMQRDVAIYKQHLICRLQKSRSRLM